MDLASIDFPLSSISAPYIVLIGPPAVGKTTVGKLLANKIAYQFIDTDHIIEEVAGKTISEIFAQDGETHFRLLEASLLTKLPKKSTDSTTGTIIACGAGLPLPPYNFDILSSLGNLIYLSASFEALLKRLDNCQKRPLLATNGKVSESSKEERLAKLILERKRTYERASLTIKTDNLSAFEVCQQIIEQLKLSLTV